VMFSSWGLSQGGVVRHQASVAAASSVDDVTLRHKYIAAGYVRKPSALSSDLATARL